LFCSSYCTYFHQDSLVLQHSLCLAVVTSAFTSVFHCFKAVIAAFPCFAAFTSGFPCFAAFTSGFPCYAA
jgi:hypothetical protein